jgi:hypothetical protein
VTREEAIERLEDTFEGWNMWVIDNDSPASKLSEALGMAIAALREQEDPKAILVQQYIKVPEQPRWISVDERLPEYWLWVQVYRSANRTMDTDFRTPSRKGGWCHYNDITHWMPLPEPPEVEV